MNKDLRRPFGRTGWYVICLLGWFAIAGCEAETRSSQSSTEADSAVALVDYVNLFMGTAGDHGQLSPSASLPFGMVKLGPETDPTNHSGYDYNAEKIEGFTHNRMEGVGCVGAGGNILIKPGVGTPDTSSTAYQKSGEKAALGYYEVVLGETAPIKSELTVTNATGWHRYTFPDAEEAWLMIDLSASHEEFIEETHTLVDKQEISGSVSAYTVCKQNKGKYRLYFNLEVDQPIDSVAQQGHRLFLFFSPQKSAAVNVKVSLSTISPEQAKRDRSVEVGNRTFEAIKQAAAAQWEAKLSKIQVEGKEEYKNLFYTNLYRSYLAPYNITSTDHTYRGSDGEVYQAEGFTYYHGWSIWDNFRTQLPLLTIIEPEVMRDICQSLVALYQQGKYNWASPTEPFPTVRTEHASIVLLDAYRKGITGFDLAAIYPYLVQELDSLPYTSPDNVLETSYDYWALSEIAGILGKQEDQGQYLAKAKEYKKTWRNKFMVMDEQSDIMHEDGLYEGTLWQYRWFVPWDVPGMMEMMGGKEAFTKQLTYFFEQELYNHGNQPDIQAPFLFHYSNTPWKSQEYVNRILTKDITQWYGTHKKWSEPYVGRIYQNDSKGYLSEMDDDAGTMSAWYVLAAMGLYPMNVGEPVYCLTTPIFPRVSIAVAAGQQFTIEAPNADSSQIYLQAAKLNGETMPIYQIGHKDIVEGGDLNLSLGDEEPVRR